MYFNYVINNARRTVTIREYDDCGDRVATYRTFPFARGVWDDVRDRIMNFDDNQEFLKSLIHEKWSRKIR